jgi:DNA-binding transcriptional LysR family regulator
MLYRHNSGGMDLKRLNTFVTVAELGTVLKAAQQLHITQPALSRQISGLEQELGFQLFERVGRRLLLTPRGEQFLADCRSLLGHAETLGERAKSLRRGDIQVLRVVASSEPIEALFPTFLHRYAEKHPAVQIALVEADPGAHLDMLERGEAHVAANVLNVVQIDPQRFSSYPMPHFHVLAACAPSLGVLGGDTIDISRLGDQPLLVPRGNFATRILFDAACRLAGMRPNLFIESVSVHALLALAEEAHGVAIVPSIVQMEHRRLQVASVTHKREPLKIEPAIVWDKRRTLPRYAESFAKLLAEHVLQFHPVTAAKPKSRERSSRR